MDRTKDGQDDRVMHEEMEAMMDSLLKKEIKRDEQRWARRFDSNPGMEQLFAAMSREELSERRKMLKLKGGGSLKKAELAQLVAQAVLERAPILFELMEQQQYQWLRRICDAGGALAVRDEDLSCLEWLYSIGWIAFGHIENRRSLIMAREMMDVFAQADGAALRKMVEENTQWIVLASGLTYYYGVLPAAEMTARLEELTGRAVEEERLQAVIAINAAEGEWSIALEHDLFFDYRVWEPAALREEQAEYEELPPYPFTYEQLYEAGQIGFIDRNSAFGKMVQLLKQEWQAELADAEEQVDEWMIMLRNGENLSEIVAFIEEEVGFPSRKVAKKMVDALVELQNGTRQWALKGHTPQELHQLHQPDSNVVLLHQPVAQRQTVGRNDSCPCGSGKKYKKCCADKPEKK